jgi:hypothetical protein
MNTELRKEDLIVIAILVIASSLALNYVEDKWKKL